MAHEPADPRDPDGYRERLERRAREAAYAQQRAGTVFRWVVVVFGAVAALGGLVLIGMTSENRPLSQGTLQVMPLQPATTPPPTSSPPPSLSSTTPALEPTTSTSTPTPASPVRLAPPPEKPPSLPHERATCMVQYRVEDQWSIGFRITVIITNAGSTPISPWLLSWTYTAGQQVELGWDGEYSQSGNRVTVAAASWNTDIDPGVTVSTGFTGSHSGSNPAPSAFTLNGTNCTTR